MAKTIAEQFAEVNMHCFLEHYGVTNDQGNKLDFKEHNFLWDIYSDFSPNQAILKAAQIGFSTAANIKSLWLAKNRRMDIIYSLPTAGDVNEFVSGKTNRLIANNEIFQKWTADKDSIAQKKVGDNIIYFRGTWVDRAALMISADLYIADEVDRSKQDVVAQFDTRLQHSDYGWRWYFSNPSAPGVGVDKMWQVSDQKHWFVKCEGCNNEFYLTMENILYEGKKPYFGCTKCRKEHPRASGRWVKRWGDKDVSGYWVSLLMCPWVSAETVLKKQKEFSQEQFANFVLGQPFIGKGNILTRPMIIQNLTNIVNPRDTRDIIGVDTGNEINYVIGNKYGLYHNDKCKDYGPIRKFLAMNPKAIAVIDQGGDIIGPRKLREEFPNRVYLCFFRADRKNDEMIKWNDDDGTVQADRTKIIQLCVDEMIEKRLPIAGTENDWKEYMDEWLGMYRTVDENALGVPVHVWNKPATGRCDYPFAQVYWRIGMDRFMDASSTFHGDTPKFGSIGYENRANDTMFMPRNQ